MWAGFVPPLARLKSACGRRWRRPGDNAHGGAVALKDSSKYWSVRASEDRSKQQPPRSGFSGFFSLLAAETQTLLRYASWMPLRSLPAGARALIQIVGAALADTTRRVAGVPSGMYAVLYWRLPHQPTGCGAAAERTYRVAEAGTGTRGAHSRPRAGVGGTDLPLFSRRQENGSAG